MSTCPSSAAEIGSGKGPSEAVFVAEFVLLLFVGRLFGEAMQRLRQPAVIGQLLAGIVLGPSVFGALWPSAHHLIFPDDHAQKAMIDGVAQLGVLLLLMLTGMETDVALVKRVGRAAVSVSLAGIAIPFACGFALGDFVIPDSHPAGRRQAVRDGAVSRHRPVDLLDQDRRHGRARDELHAARPRPGDRRVSDHRRHDRLDHRGADLRRRKPGGLDWRSLAISIGSTALFLVVSYTLGRRIVALLIRWANDRLVSELPVITMILIIMGAHGDHHRRDRGQYGARRLRGRCSDRPVATADQAHRRPAARPHRGPVRARVLRPRRPVAPTSRSSSSRPCSA